MKDLYLCDSKVENCTKEECYKNGGDCYHTENAKHAINPPEKRKFIKSAQGDNWELEE